MWFGIFLLVSIIALVKIILIECNSNFKELFHKAKNYEYGLYPKGTDHVKNFSLLKEKIKEERSYSKK